LPCRRSPRDFEDRRSHAWLAVLAGRVGSIHYLVVDFPAQACLRQGRPLLRPSIAYHAAVATVFQRDLERRLRRSPGRCVHDVGSLLYYLHLNVAELAAKATSIPIRPHPRNAIIHICGAQLTIAFCARPPLRPSTWAETSGFVFSALGWGVVHVRRYEKADVDDAWRFVV